jgi:hypothetical protein
MHVSVPTGGTWALVVSMLPALDFWAAPAATGDAGVVAVGGDPLLLVPPAVGSSGILIRLAWISVAGNRAAPTNSMQAKGSATSDHEERMCISDYALTM